MRTTLTIDEDVAIALERVREREFLSLKAVVNQALRRGLSALEADARRSSGERYQLLRWNGGGVRIAVDSVAEALAWAEGEGHR